MSGSLVEIAESNYNHQDMYLVNKPQITYFKSVFKRHTNFSVECVAVNFDDTVGFNKQCTVKLPKIGDLVSNMYLEVTLPAIQFTKDGDYINSANIEKLQTQLNKLENEYTNLLEYATTYRKAFIAAHDVYIAENNNNKIKDMINSIKGEFGGIKYSIGNYDIKNIIKTDNKDSKQLYNQLLKSIEKISNLQNFYLNNIQNTKKQLQNEQSTAIKFAWIKKIGHYIMDWIEIKISSNSIERHSDDWINIWHELNGNNSLEHIYDEMIGNIDILTTFDKTKKPSYKLRIPLQFSLCRHSGTAFPLCALKHQDFTIDVKFKKFEKLCYIEKDTPIKKNNLENDIDLDDVVEDMNININAKLLIDYVYLDIDERKRFLKFNHEYLIEQVQYYKKDNVQSPALTVNINNFINPTKELIWIVQDKNHTKNNGGSNINLRYDIYSASDSNKNPITTTSIDLNNINHIDQTANYFNYLQPYEHHNRTPCPGVNCCSFSISPDELQPTGSINLSNISKLKIHMILDNNVISDSSLVLKVFSRSLNILRFGNGYAGLAWR